MANETIPSGLISVKGELYIAPDESLWIFMGAPFNWVQIAENTNLQALSENISANNLTYSDPIIPSAIDGSISSVQLPSLFQDLFIEAANVQGMSYSIGDTLSEQDKIAAYNSATRTITFPSPLWSSFNVWYKGSQGETVSTGIITVDTHQQMINAAIGNKFLKIFVNQASQYNDAGDFFDYIPGKGIAYLGIDFNYTE
jgi:hypothetical protein